MALVAPQKENIDRLGWKMFVDAGSVDASRSVVKEFYSNLAGQPGHQVFVRGIMVNISPAAINQFYGLQDYPDDGFSHMLQDEDQEPSPADVAARLCTRSAPPLLPDWHSVPRGSLTTEAKNWAYFVGARLLPVKMGSEVHKGRALLTYAILSGLQINVGRIIHTKMIGVSDGRANRSMGYPSLITQLYTKAGVDITSEDPADVIKPQPRITSEMYQHAAKALQRLRAVAEDVAEEEAEQDDQEEAEEEERYQQYYHQPAGPVYLEP